MTQEQLNSIELLLNEAYSKGYEKGYRDGGEDGVYPKDTLEKTSSNVSDPWDDKYAALRVTEIMGE